MILRGYYIYLLLVFLLLPLNTAYARNSINDSHHLKQSFSLKNTATSVVLKSETDTITTSQKPDTGYIADAPQQQELPINATTDADIAFHLSDTFLQGKKILKVKRDFKDPYLWVLAENNQLYRINSITKAVDDYTAKFSAYSGFKFIDIAGVNQDQVYVATSVANLIEYKNGNFRNIGAADAIPGNITSIGTDYTGFYVPDLTSNTPGNRKVNTILIGTVNGMCHFDYDNGVMTPGTSHVPARVFEATYRTEMFSALEFGDYPDVVKQYAALSLTTSILGGFLWYGNNSVYGNNINTAYTTTGVVIDNVQGYYPNDFMNLYWGTENGLFQNYFGESNNSTDRHNSYLTGINVTKITSILGLRAFGTSNNAGLIKENLLAGSDQGLYYSNSGYWQTGSVQLPTYTFFKYDGLGNKRINDICVNATSYATPICEDGVWVAADDGLYLLKPDYSPFVNTSQQLSAATFDGQSYGVSQMQICANTTVSATISPYIYSGNTIQWYKDGQEIPNASSAKLVISQSGDYYAVLYDPCSPTHFESNHLKVTVITAPVFAFDYPDQINYCDGSTATLQTDNNAAYKYQWYKDGVLNGNTSAILNATQSGKYRLEVSACQGSWVTSKEVQLNFIKITKPVLAADNAFYCEGADAILNATVAANTQFPVNWGPYQYQWYKDGVVIPGTTASLKVNTAGSYQVRVMACAGNSALSDEVQISFISKINAVIGADKSAYCSGDYARLSINPVDLNTYTISWYNDQGVLTANQDKAVLTTNIPGNYYVSIGSRLTPCATQSQVYPVVFQSPPAISIQQLANTLLCDGAAMTLKANYATGAIKWSTGETTDQIIVKKAGTYSVVVTTSSGCQAQAETSVTYLSNPVIAVPDATLCPYNKESISLSAPKGLKAYYWNGVLGSSTYTTSQLGQVSLTVVDNNDCQATQIINISLHCDEIHIPNTFTPNGDSVNDTWIITGLEGDNSSTVRVYNRYGNLVFQSTGYDMAWNGLSNGKKLPTGVYYYVISARAGKQVLSGSITIVR